jgi:hypothetical protein
MEAPSRPRFRTPLAGRDESPVNGKREPVGRGSHSLTGWDTLEVSLALLLGGRCLLEGVCYKQLARKRLHVLKAEYRYGQWRVRSFYVLLGLLLMLLGVLLALIVNTPSLA